jgi:hypothetical protein
MALATFTSNVTPPIPITAEGGGEGGGLAQWLQPTVNVAGVIHLAPWGDANPTLGTAVFYTVLGLAIYGLYRAVRG